MGAMRCGGRGRTAGESSGERGSSHGMHGYEILMKIEVMLVTCDDIPQVSTRSACGADEQVLTRQ